MVNRVPSSWSKVVSGVPQGNVLGPILFLIFINDLPNYVECSVKLFAGDTKLYFIANCPIDSNLIQNDIDHMNKWSDCWLLVFNAKKCKVIHYGNSKQHNQYTLKALDVSTLILKKFKMSVIWALPLIQSCHLENTLHTLITRRILLLG